MKAAVLFEANTPLSIEDVTVSKPGPREVLIRTMAVGVCRSDLHFVDGAYPHAMPTIPGHEACGVVEAIGDEVGMVKVGDHVVTCLSAFCGHCEFCVTGRMAAAAYRAISGWRTTGRRCGRCASPMVRTKSTTARSRATSSGNTATSARVAYRAGISG